MLRPTMIFALLSVSLLLGCDKPKQPSTTTTTSKDAKNTAGEDAKSGEDRADDAVASGVEGMLVVESRHDFSTTCARLEKLLKGKDLVIMERFDHQENARSVERDLGPTAVYVFGNPALGTQLMQENPMIGLDLPMKMLVWKQEEGTPVKIGYNDPLYLIKRHNLESKRELAEKMAATLETIAEQAAGKRRRRRGK